MNLNSLVVLSGLGLGTLLASAPLSAQAPSLGAAGGFAVLAGSTVTSAGNTVLAGDLGVAPGTSISGFPPGILTGTIHAGDVLALQAQGDLTLAYDALAGLPTSVVLTGQDLGGLTLTPGVYRFAASAPLNGALTLDAQGDPSAVFVFQIGSTLLAALDSSVLTINGAQPDNVFWQVGSSATLGAGVAFTGNVVALASITLSSGSTLAGRALARTAAVTMDTASVTVPAGNSCATPASVVELTLGCGAPAPTLVCSPLVMGSLAQLTLDGSTPSVPGFLRLTPFGGRVTSFDDCHVYFTTASYALASFVTDASGDFALSRTIPANPLLCGTRWVLQGLVLAPSGTRKFAASNALLVTLGS